jgi:hydrogenase-4 component E
MENIFIILLGLSMIYIASTSRLAAHVNMLVAQGWLLFFVCLSGFAKEPWFVLSTLTNKEALLANLPHIWGLLFVVFETLIIKAFVIPWFLKKVVKKTHAHRDTDANIPHFYCLFIASIILFAGFLTANISTPDFQLVDPMYFGVSLAIIITSLWLITIKHKVLSNVIGFITMENGIFLLSLSIAKEMPIIVNLGVLLDLFIAVFILGMLVREINNEFDDLEVSQLSDLKDYEYND